MTRVSDRVLILDGSTTHGRDVIGNKGASIAEMRALGLPVPPAFVLPIDECRRYHAGGGHLDEEVWQQVLEGIAGLERDTGRRLGDPDAPLLVSVRSGAAVSMPGMMDTILNLGITDAVQEGLARLSGNPDFARETHVRFCHEFAHTVMSADFDVPDGATAADLRKLVLDDTGEELPATPHEQLRAAIHAVFGSWSSRRAIAYRRHWGIPEDGGTAVIVQAMVFGNLGEGSGTGVLFSRDPLSGEPAPYGEWLAGGQGEDVVSGTHDPKPLSELADTLPAAHAQLLDAMALLERTHGDVQDIEFTIERERLYLLQTRSAKRSPLAAVRTAVDLANEGAIDADTAVRRVSPEQVVSVLAPRLAGAVASGAEMLARGTPACPGVAAGRVVGDTDAAEAAADPVVLVRPTTSPEDVAGMIAAHAVVTERGGSTSHAAVVTRALGCPSVVGVGEGVTDAWTGREVTVDGTTGVVYGGVLPTEVVRIADIPGLEQLIAWARERCPVTVRDEAEGVLDLDEVGLQFDPDHKPDVDALAARMQGAAAVRGSVLATSEGACAVLRGGVPVVVPVAGQHAEALILRFAQARDA